MQVITLAIADAQANRLQGRVIAGEYASIADIVQDALYLWEHASKAGFYNIQASAVVDGIAKAREDDMQREADPFGHGSQGR
jgi:Arc/MetJ-type ribon-helix-helix transcriptional regulator